MSKLTNAYVEASLKKLEQSRLQIRQQSDLIGRHQKSLQEMMESFYHDIDALRRELENQEKYSVAMYVEPEFVEMVKRVLHPEQYEE